MGRIAAGDRTNCAVVESRLACWGDNGRGQLGDGTTTKSLTATFVPNLTGVESVAASERNTCAVVTGGLVKCWGDNTYGQLGNQTTSSSSTTKPVSVCAIAGCSGGQLTGVTQISMGFGFACALLADTGVACWGYNDRYQIGDLDLTMTQTWPARVPTLTGVTAISSGQRHTCAVLSSGAMKCWGDNQYGQLGNGFAPSSKVTSIIDVDRAGVTGVTAVAATLYATCAIVGDATVKCWGGDTANELGYADSDPSKPSYSFPMFGEPTKFTTHAPVTARLGGTDITAKAIDAGPRAVCVINLDDDLACWGSIAGLGIQTGGTNFGSAFSSNWVSGMTSTTNVAVSTSTVCATNAGQVQCWGAGPHGELGNDTSGSSSMAAVAVQRLAYQTISFSALADRSLAADPFTLTATASSGQTVTFSTSDAMVCTATDTGGQWQLRVMGAGTCTVTATAAGGTVSSVSYSAATSSQSFTVAGVAPVVTTDAATQITTTTATLTASINPARNETITVFRWSTRADMSGSLASTPSTIAADAGTVTRTANITGLSPGTTYHFRVDSTSTAGTTTSATRSFTTIGFAPTVTTGSTSSVSSSRATLNASVTPGGTSTEVWFIWGQKADLSDGSKVSYRAISDLTAVDVSVTVTGLTESTRYYYRVEATNDLGSAKGDIKSFTASRPLGISVNNAAEFTNSRKVTIYATGPSGATQVILSNDGGFGASQTFDLTDGYAEISWTLVASRDERLPKTVYARFVQRFGSQSSTNTDDIILDTTAPTMTSASGASTGSSPSGVAVQSVVAAAAKGGVRLTVRAKDANSGIGTVQVKTSSRGGITAVPTSNPKASSRTLRLNTTKKRLWVRVVDRAGNVSRWVTISVK